MKKINLGLLIAVIPAIVGVGAPLFFGYRYILFGISTNDERVFSSIVYAPFALVLSVVLVMGVMALFSSDIYQK
jgi:hypothetical protein